MVVFIDPKQSYQDIIQNVGRICRKQDKKSTVYIPIQIECCNYEKLTNVERKSNFLQEQLYKNGNFNFLLNILFAMGQQDPEYYDSCLKYTNKFTTYEIKNNIEKQKYKLVVCKNLKEALLRNNVSIDVINKLIFEDDPKDTLNLVSGLCKRQVELHSTDLEKPIKYIGEEYIGSFIRIYIDDKQSIYAIITSDTNTINKKITLPIKKRLPIKIYQSNDIQMLIDIKNDIDLQKEIQTAYLGINATIIQWNHNYEEVKDWIKIHNKYPAERSKDKTEKKYGVWCSVQRRTYAEGVLSQERIKKLEELNEWFWSLKDKWNENYDNVSKWIKEKERIPLTSSKDVLETKYGYWCSNQRSNKKNNRLSQAQIDKLENIKEWNWGKEDIWTNTYENIKKWIEKNNRIPSDKSDNPIEKKYGTWCSSQRRYKKKGTLQEDRIQKLEEISDWYWNKKDFWYNIYNDLVEWINKNKKIPLYTSKDDKEKTFGYWCSNQRQKKKKENYVLLKYKN